MYKSILVENRQMRLLLSVIKSHYISDNHNRIQEVNMIHVVNRINDETIRNYVIDCWYNLQRKVGYEVTLLEDNSKKSIINKLYKRSSSLSFVIKTKPDQSSYEIHKSIKRISNIDVIIKEFKI
ncbi:normocyte binding protein 2b [Francisella sp. LA112445]|uniref:normocyte binding protein 2b n=1 Tax=Francisella sp. LA112445 TaxID=1395624 RepID=UPI001788A376|nr:normocyte binding protein 2b [Francisella sp. LA112445]QIW09157.1 normocyte binding protein 2b [Francisella sp. LA112445]